MFEMDSSRRCAIDEQHNNQEGESDPLLFVLSNSIDRTTNQSFTHSLTRIVGSYSGVGAIELVQASAEGAKHAASS